MVLEFLNFLLCCNKKYMQRLLLTRELEFLYKFRMFVIE